MSYERSEGAGTGLRILTGVFLGLTVANIIHAALDNTDARIKGVQINNEQLRDQLTPAHEIEGLILNDDSHTFTFHSRAQDGQPEICRGKYDVQNDIAHVAGPLACTQTVAVR